ncbi:MAG: tape measure protein [Sporolactobacillus sp.]
MVVHIGLDKTEMTQGLTAMKNTVRAATAEWKTQFSVFNQLGDHVKAAESKYKGLTTAIEAQKKVIGQEQSQLSNLGTRTKDNADAYDKLSSQINQNANKLAGLTSQQEKARKMYEYEQSGIRGNKEELSLLAREMQSTVNMYKAQGDEESASAAKAEGLRKQLSQLNDIQQKEESILAKVGKESGKNSSAYREQGIRMADLRTKIASVNGELSDMEGSARKPLLSLTRLRDGIGKTREAAHGTAGVFKSMLGASLVSGAILSGFSSIKNYLTEAAHAGAEYNKQQQVMGATWNTLTDSASKGNKMIKSINGMSVAFGQSTDLVNELDQQFYHVFDNQPRTEKLTKSMLTLGDTLGMNSDDLKRLGLNFTHMLSSGKMQLGDFNMITDQLPMYGSKLLEYEQKVQHNSNLTMAQMRKEMSTGKISAKDAEAVMEELGQKYSKASENMMKTLPGMERVVSSRMPALIGAFEKPFQKAQSGLFSGISKWVSATPTEKLFTQMGAAASKGMTTIMNAFGKVFGSKGVTKTADDAVKGLSGGIEKFSNLIADHAQGIVKFFSTIKENGVNGFKALVEVLKVTSTVMRPILQLAGKSPKQFAAFAIGIMATVKAFQTLRIVTAAFGVTLGATPMGWIIGAVGLLALGAVELITHWKQVKSFFAGLGKWFSGLWGDIKSLFSSGVSFVKKHAELFIAALGPIGWAIDGVIEIVKHWGSIAKTVTKAWDGVASFFSGVWKKIEKGGSSLLSWFKKLPSRMWSNVKSGFKKLGNWIKSIWDDASDHVSSGWKSLSSWFKKLPGRTWSAVKSKISDLWSGMKWLSSHVWDRIEDWGSDLWKWMKKLPGRVWSNIKNNASDLWSGIKWLGSHAYDRFKSWGTDIIDWFKKLPGRMADGIKNGAKALGNAGIFIGNKLIDGVQKVINGVIDGIDWLGDKVGLGKHLIKPASLPNIGYFAEGTYDSTGRFLKDTLIHVGDGNKKEIVRHKDGSLDLTPDRDTLMVAKRGDSILGGDKTEQLLKMLPHFSVGSFFGSVGDFVKGGWDKLSSGASAVWDALSHPTKLLNTVMDKFAGSAVGNLSGAMANVGEGIVKTMIKSAGKIVDNLFGGASDPGGSGVQRWAPDVKRALGMLGLSTSGSMISRVLRQIKTESGGNPKALGGDDGLSDGRAMGLMQVKPGTFAAYHLKGFADTWKGFDNMLAGLNYAKHRYGPGLSFLGQGHGYANGGLVTTAQIASIAEGNKAEMVIPLTNQNRALQLMYQALDYFKGNSSSGSQQSQQQTTVDNSQLIQVLQQTNQLIASFMQLVDQKPTGITNQQVYNANKQVSDQNTRIRNLAMGRLT